ncbi:MAG: acyltransferase [Betaproteobacteria bacterium]
MTSARPPLAHLDALTGVRALAALWVFFYHMWLASGAKPVLVALGLLQVDLTPWFAFGWLGLDIFFILSGFLLTRQEWLRLGRKETREEIVSLPQFRTFYATFLRKRILRVYPAYYGCLTLLLVLAATHLYLRLPGRLELLLHLGMMHNVIEAYIATMNGAFWTLPFEWQFYLIFPLLFVLLARAGPWTLALVTLCAVYAAKAHVIVNFDGFMQTQLPIRLDAFAFGMCAGRFAARTPLNARHAQVAFYAGLLVLFATPLVFADLPTGNHYYTVKGFIRPAWIQLGVILMLLGMTGGQHPGVAIFGNRVAVGLGLISYSIYLLHIPAIEMFILHRDALGPLATLPYGLPLLMGCVLPLVLIASTLSYKLIEQPFLRRRARSHHGWFGNSGGLLDRVDPLLVLLAWAILLMVALELLR